MGGKQETSGWSDMQAELLELVLRSLDRRDYLKCRLVCRGWRSIVNGAIKNKGPPTPRFPARLLLPPTLLCNTGDPTTLFDDITRDNRLLRVPTHVGKGHFASLRSEEEGWLMFQSICNNLLWIFNPVSSESYKLPQLPPGHTIPYNLRVAFSSQSYLVVISLYSADDKDGSIPQLCFCRVDNDKSWSRIETIESRFEVKDIMLLGWKLYAMNEDFVTIFNLEDLNAITAERLVMQLPKLDSDGERVNMHRLARDPTCGEVLLVLFRCKYMSHDYEIEDFLIFKLDMSGPRWIEVHSLSGRVLFVDRAGVRVISTANLNAPPKFIGVDNCVFFSLHHLINPCLGVFYLKEKTIQPLNSNLSLEKQLWRSLWFTPSPSPW
ncbi:uncharacterized protein LOC130725668 [Lotus japonicus]|uniref:uncharacterized protein LOC130725668 n=1 Tax=Lotus japonicus TaxID=34305 RepID=UPI00258467F6|nr:uncharacterized protein LOC130725668 [Lotus japonicus]